MNIAHVDYHSMLALPRQVLWACCALLNKLLQFTAVGLACILWDAFSVGYSSKVIS